MVDEIIPNFPAEEQAELKKAADEWRYPFWDFAVKKPNADGTEWNYDAPKCIREKEVEVKVPGGKETIPNPFYQFRMPNGYTMGDDRIKPNVVTREPVRVLRSLSRYVLTKNSTTVPRQLAATPTLKGLGQIPPMTIRRNKRDPQTLTVLRINFRRGNGKLGGT
jgi:Common central domain of tyrosinase